MPTPQEDEELKRLMISALATIGAPQAPAPQAPSGLDAPYNAQANKYRSSADNLDQQASTPYPQPKGLKENIVKALGAGMESFGRWGAPGGYAGQEKIRQDRYQEEQKTKIERAKALRTEAQQQQELGQTVAQRGVQNFNDNEQLGISRGNLAVSQDNSKRAERIANRPVLDNNTPGTSSFGRDPNTLRVLPGTEVDTPPKPPTEKAWQYKDLSVDGKKEVWAIDPLSGTPHHKVGDAFTDPNSGADGMQIVQGQVGADGAPTFVRIPKNGPAGVVSVNGEVVGTKPAEAPTQLKNQGDSAYTTTQMAGIVRNLVKAKPQLVGAIGGRVNQLALQFGDNPAGLTAAANGMQPGDEKDAALLAGHMAYLFLNEARATMPGRPSKDYMDFVKSRSAQMSQSPNFIEGYLQSAENNARIIMDLSEKAGYSPWRTMPAAGGKIRVRQKATGKTGTIDAGDFDASRYEKL